MLSRQEVGLFWVTSAVWGAQSGEGAEFPLPLGVLQWESLSSLARRLGMP